MALNNYGLLWGSVPGFMGRAFFVSPAASYSIEGRSYTASDNHDGTDPRRALRTISQAITNCTANVDDVIILLPGVHAPAASLAMSKAGVTLTGLISPHRNQLGGGATAGVLSGIPTITGLAGDETINITATDVTLSNLRFVQATAVTCIDFASASRLLIQDCVFSNTAAANTSGIALGAGTAPGAGTQVKRCLFQTNGANGNFIVATGLIQGSLIEDCKFHVFTGTLASCILVGASTGIEVNRCRFLTTQAGLITIGINGTGATLVPSCVANDNRFSVGVSKALDNFDATEADICNNYQATDTGGTGGSLITVTT